MGTPSSESAHRSHITAAPERGRGRPSGAQAARDRASRNAGGLSALLDARPDLLGVHAPADLAYDAIRWSA